VITPRLSAVTIVLLILGSVGAVAQMSAVPPQQAAKPIRVWGYTGVQPVMLRWEAAYRSEHPDVTFENKFYGAAAAAAGLYNNVADIVATGREMWTVDLMAFHWVFQYAPFGVEVLASGTDAPAPSYTPVVIVNRANPINEISMEDLDALYGSQHKAAQSNARRWSDLGVGGALANRTIRPVGFSEDNALGVFWRLRVLKEDYKPNPASALLRSEAEVAQRVAADPAAIGYTSGSAAAKVRGAKVIAVNDLFPSGDTIAVGSYPLARTVALYVNRKPEERIPPEVEKFLLFCLSDPAQVEVHAEEGFVALPNQTRKRMERRIDSEWTGKDGWKQ